MFTNPVSSGGKNNTASLPINEKELQIATMRLELKPALEAIQKVNAHNLIVSKILDPNENLTKKERIEIIENELSKYDYIESNLADFLNGASDPVTGRVKENIAEIKNALSKKLDAVSQIDNYLSYSADLLITNGTASFEAAAQRTSERARLQSLICSNEPKSILPTRDTRTSTVSSIAPRTNGSILNGINGVRYFRRDEVGDGNCGAKAVQVVCAPDGPYNPEAMRSTLIHLKSQMEVLNPEITNISTQEAKFEAIQQIYPDFATCKKCTLQEINTKLNGETLSDSTRLSYTQIKDVFESTNDYNDLWEKCSVEPELLTSFIAVMTPSFEISKTCGINGAWFGEGDVKASMLQEKFLFNRYIVLPPKEQAAPDAWTVLEFTHATTNEKAYIACNAKPEQTNGVAPRGSHWVGVTPIDRVAV